MKEREENSLKNVQKNDHFESDRTHFGSDPFGFVPFWIGPLLEFLKKYDRKRRKQLKKHTNK